MKETAIIAIGGNSLISDKGRQTVRDQFKTSRITCRHIGDMIQRGWNVVITHGNGPQVGFILLRSEIAAGDIHTVPLDSVGADSQGSIGYMLQQNLYNEFRGRNIDKECCTVITQCVVDRDDGGFKNPTKPIGPWYSEEEIKEKREEEGWDIVEVPGKGWRRVVASPRPLRIVEMESIRGLIEAGVIAIAVGGGGIPVVEDVNGALTGVPAVIDKDRASSLLARHLSADLFLISTDIERVCLNYGQADARSLDAMTLSEAEGYYEAGEFLPGSMGPKIEAAMDFLRARDGKVVITCPEKIGDALKGEAGTHITRD